MPCKLEGLPLLDTHGVNLAIPKALLAAGQLLKEAAVAESNNDLLRSTLHPLSELPSADL